MGANKKLYGRYDTGGYWLPIKVSLGGSVIIDSVPSHYLSHQNGGVDEINVTGLEGSIPTITNYTSTITSHYTYTNTEADTGLTITVPAAVLNVNKIALIIAHLNIIASSTTAQRIVNYLNIIGVTIGRTDTWTIASIPHWTINIQRITKLASGADRIIKIRGFNVTNTSVTKLSQI